MSSSPNLDHINNNEGQEINLKQLFEQYAYYWKWFILSVILCLVSAVIYLRYADKIYSINSKILLQDENKATGELAGLSELASLGGIGGTTSSFVADQIDVMKSRRIFRKVVEQNRLNVIYYNKGNLKSNELMESQSPLKLVILDVNNSKLDSVRYDFVIKKKDNNKYTIEDKVNGLRDYILGQKISSPIGPIMILPQGNKGIDSDMIISYFPLNDVIDVLLNSVQIAPNKEKQSYVVNFSMNSGNINKAELILKS